MLFTCKNVAFRFYAEKNFLLHEMMGEKGKKEEGGRVTPPCPPPFSLALYYAHIMDICFSSKFALSIPSISSSFLSLFPIRYLNH